MTDKSNDDPQREVLTEEHKGVQFRIGATHIQPDILCRGEYGLLEQAPDDPSKKQWKYVQVPGEYTSPTKAWDAAREVVKQLIDAGEIM